MRSFKIAAALMLGASLAACSTMGDDMGAEASASTRSMVTVGGAPMYASRNIIENAVNSPDHKTLVAAVKAAGLVETLSGAGPFTVFAPTDAAFARLPQSTVPMLLRPENKSMLQSALTYHVVPGRLTAADLGRQIRDGGGMARLTTVQGGMLTARMNGSDIVIVDSKGGVATVTQADVMQSNGVIHVTNRVSMSG
ncbi:MAG TPA: fasciclin domain-containing protein [Allosphingosinicella sp.]|jgi:uncharacterized surface protein with fasciclin (FAS1) repeats